MHFSCFTFVHSLASVWIVSVVILGFMLFVLSLRKNHYKVQFSLVSPSFGVTRRGLELLSLSSAQAMVLLHVTSDFGVYSFAKYNSVFCALICFVLNLLIRGSLPVFLLFSCHVLLHFLGQISYKSALHSQFGWTHVTLLIVVTQSHLIMHTMFEGLMW